MHKVLKPITFFVLGVALAFGGTALAATTIGNNITTGGTVVTTGSISTSGTLMSTRGVDVEGTAGGYKIDGNLILNVSSTNHSTAVGYEALLANTANAFSNSAFGYQALKSNTTIDEDTGSNNSAFGALALNENTTGSQNVAVGESALVHNTTASGNIAVGGLALGYNTTGQSNTGLGLNAGIFNVTGDGNTSVGYAALGQGGLGSSYNSVSALGSYAGRSVTNGSDYGTYIGASAGYNATGPSNIIIGAATSSASYNNDITTGGQNIIIGTNIAPPSRTNSGQLDIGNLIYGTGLFGVGTTVSAGKIGIGITNPATRLHVSSGANSTTTVSIGELGNMTSKGCVNMNQADGTPGSFYIMDGALVVENAYCR